MRITGEIVAMAMNATTWHRSQVQGFCYNTAGQQQTHVVRDFATEGGRIVWSETADGTDYDKAHARMLLEIERRQAEILADRINVLIGS